MIEHKTTVRANWMEEHSDYKLEAVCSCQWQALAHTEEEAERLIQKHLLRHGAPKAQAVERG